VVAVSLGNRRTGEIDDGIGAVKTMLPGSCLSSIPLDCRDSRDTGALRFNPSREEGDPMPLLTESGT